MKLYSYPGAPNPRRVHVFLAEKGLTIPVEEVDILARQNKEPAYLDKVDPMGRVPVLELDDGSHIAESVAICRYLEALHPEPPLFGREPVEQARIEMWLRRIELDFMVPLGLVWIHGSPLTRGVMKQQIPEVAAQNRARVEQYYGFLDGQLGTREFIAGDDYSMADIVALCTLDFAESLNQLAPSPDLGHLAAWRKRVSDRPSASA